MFQNNGHKLHYVLISWSGIARVHHLRSTQHFLIWVQIVFAKRLTKKKGSELQKERISEKRGFPLAKSISLALDDKL
jgi:hypothetical protein